MRRQQDRLPRRRERGDRRAQLAGPDRIEPDRRLVEEEHLRVVQEAAGDVQPLLHAARVPLRPLVLAAFQPDEVEQLLDPALLRPRRHAVELGEVAKIVVPGEPFIDAALAAEDVANPLANLARILDDVPAEHPCRARGRNQQRDQHLDRRRLAGPVRAEQAEELPRLDREAHPANGLDLLRPATNRAGVRPIGPPQLVRLDRSHGPQTNRGNNLAKLGRARRRSSAG